MSQKTDRFASGPPYKIQKESGLSCFNYDVFSNQNIAEMVQILEDLLMQWKRSHLYWFNVQFPHWTDDIGNWAKAGLESSDGSPKDQNGEERLFYFEKKNIVYVRDQINVSQHFRKSLYHVSMTECVNQF